MNAPFSLRQKWSDLGIVFLLKSDHDIKVQAPKGVLTSDVLAEIKLNKPHLIQWLKNRSSENCSSTEEASSKSPSFIAHASADEVTQYRHLIEGLFNDPSQDASNDLSQKFRNGTIRFDEMESAVMSLMSSCEKETTRLDISSLGLLGFTEREKAIILSYPVALHPFLKSLVRISKAKAKAEDSDYSFEQLNNFHHNMRHLFVEIRGKQDHYSANLITLWSDDWTEDEIIQFMMSQKVKYIMCHNAKLIQCLDLNNKVYVFYKPADQAERQ